MRHYELLVVVKPTLTVEELQAKLSFLKEILEKSYLEEFDEIYYLNSTKIVDENSLIKTISEGNLKLA